MWVPGRDRDATSLLSTDIAAGTLSGDRAEAETARAEQAWHAANPGCAGTPEGRSFRSFAARLGWRRGFMEAFSGSTEPGSPWENGYVESFNGKLRDELLRMEVFNTLLEASILIEQRRVHYNTVRPHSSLGYRPPAPEVIMLNTPMPPGRPGPTGSLPPSATMLH